MCIKKSQEPPKYALPTNDTRHIFPIKDGPVTKETCHCQKWQGVWTQFPYVILWHNGVKVFMRSYYHFYYASTISKQCNRTFKGQIKPKADWRTIDSPKKRTNVCVCFLLITSVKRRSFIFLEESTARQSAFCFISPLVVSNKAHTQNIPFQIA